MINQKQLRISIVIPVYNEADHLPECLDAVAALQPKPFEVIVVDNNSTDETLEILKRYQFVTVLQEPKQGVVHARTLGFNAARGDIIGRIDADTHLPTDWCQQVSRVFRDDQVAGVSGSVQYYDVTHPRLSGRFDLIFRQWLAAVLGNEVFLYGANMAIRRVAWNQTKTVLCYGGGIHEDFDLAIHMEQLGQRISFDPELKAEVSLRRFNGSLRSFLAYARLSPKTYALHGRRSQRCMYVVIAVVVCNYWFIRLHHRTYTPGHEGITWRNLFIAPGTVRVNPASFVE